MRCFSRPPAGPKELEHEAVDLVIEVQEIDAHEMLNAALNRVS